MSEEEKKAIELINLLYTDNLTQFGKRQLADMIEKQKTKIKELEADLYSANCIIDDYIEERNRLKNKMIGDKMEQFDDYIIYLIESYLKILEE